MSDKIQLKIYLKRLFGGTSIFLVIWLDKNMPARRGFGWDRENKSWW